MTLEQVYSLNEDELGLALYVVNVISPVSCVGEIPPEGLTWFRKGHLEKKLTEVSGSLKLEAYPIYASLLTKLGIPHEIKCEQPSSGSL